MAGREATHDLRGVQMTDVMSRTRNAVVLGSSVTATGSGMVGIGTLDTAPPVGVALEAAVTDGAGVVVTTTVCTTAVDFVAAAGVVVTMTVCGTATVCGTTTVCTTGVAGAGAQLTTRTSASDRSNKERNNVTSLTELTDKRPAIETCNSGSTSRCDS